MVVLDKNSVDWEFYVDRGQSKKKLIISACNGGLCNRMLVASGCLRLCRKLGRNFILWWPINGEDGVGCRFEELFTNTDIRLLSEFDVHWMLDCSNTLKVYDHRQLLQVKGDDQEHILVMKMFYWPRLEFENSPEESFRAEREMIAILRKFKPVDEILERVESTGVTPEMFGVHVRREPAFVGSTLEKFFSEVDAKLNQRRQPFFLATDFKPVEDAFRERYGSLVVTQPKEIWPPRHEDEPFLARCSLDGMREAAADLYLLARCNLVIGTLKSTFSQVASMISGCPLISV